MTTFKMIRQMVAIALYVTASIAQADSIEEEIKQLQQEWAATNYQLPEEEREKSFEALSLRARALSNQYPKHAEPLIWEGIILSTYAGTKGGLGALGLVTDARDRLLEAEKINPKVLNGSVYTSLGSLYYQVPGWPISFGDDDKSKQYLKQALRINPDGIDPNYFYGDFLIEQGQYKQAIQVLKKALRATPRPDRPIADRERRKEIDAKIAHAQALIFAHNNQTSGW